MPWLGTERATLAYQDDALTTRTTWPAHEHNNLNQKVKFLENRVAVPQEVKYRVYHTIQQFQAWVMYPRELKTCLHEHMYYSWKHYSQQPQSGNNPMSMDEWLDTQNMVYLNNGVFSHKKNEILMHATTWVTLKHWEKWRKSDTKGHILCDSIYMNVRNWQTHSFGMEVSACWGKEGGTVINGFLFGALN